MADPNFTTQQLLRELQQELGFLRAFSFDLKRLVDALNAPVTRVATLDLPSGTATMTVKETRGSS